jgi:hypothetical protein
MRWARSDAPEARALALALALLGGLAWACSKGAGESAPPAGDVHAAAKGENAPDGTLLHLEGRSGTPDELWGEASYKVKRKNGTRIRQLELDVVNATPGVAHVLSLDGFELGKLTVKRKGSLEFEISEEDEQMFPAGFPEPKAGSVFRVGELMELHLDNLEKLTDLEAPIAGPGALSGKVGFKIERLGSVVTREFQVKVESAPVKTVHAVTLDGVPVGELLVDLEGAGKLKYSTKEPPPFPAAFPEPHAGSTVLVGELFSGKLEDALAGAAR